MRLKFIWNALSKMKFKIDINNLLVFSNYINENLECNNRYMNQCGLGIYINQEATHSCRRKIYWPPNIVKSVKHYN